MIANHITLIPKPNEDFVTKTRDQHMDIYHIYEIIYHHIHVKPKTIKEISKRKHRNLCDHELSKDVLDKIQLI